MRLPVQHGQSRGSAHERGYTRRWSRYAKVFLQDHPLCARCLREGKAELAEMVDHILPVLSADDPGFWKESNHQALSRKCHALKTAEDTAKGLTRMIR